MSPHLTLIVKIEIVIENALLKQQQRQKKKWRAAPRVCIYIYIYTRIGNPLMTTNAVYIHVYFGILAHTYTFILMGSTTVTWNERIMTGNS